jgi:hypothetical protein
VGVASTNFVWYVVAILRHVRTASFLVTCLMFPRCYPCVQCQPASRLCRHRGHDGGVVRPPAVAHLSSRVVQPGMPRVAGPAAHVGPAPTPRDRHAVACLSWRRIEIQAGMKPWPGLSDPLQSLPPYSYDSIHSSPSPLISSQRRLSLLIPSPAADLGRRGKEGFPSHQAYSCRLDSLIHFA